MHTPIVSSRRARARGAWSGRHGARCWLRWHVVCRGLGARSLALSRTSKCCIAVMIMPRYCGDFLASTLIEGCLLYTARNKTTVGGGLGSVTRDDWGHILPTPLLGDQRRPLSPLVSFARHMLTLAQTVSGRRLDDAAGLTRCRPRDLRLTLHVPHGSGNKLTSSERRRPSSMWSRGDRLKASWPATALVFIVRNSGRVKNCAGQTHRFLVEKTHAHL